MMNKKSLLFVLLTVFVISPSIVYAVPHYGSFPVITDDKSNELILEGDTITIHNSTDTVVISRTDTGISFNGAFLSGVNWTSSNLTSLDADLLDGLHGDSYLLSYQSDTFSGSTLFLNNTGIRNIDWLNSDDGSGSSLDSDLWDGYQYSDIDSDGDNKVNNSDLLDGYEASQFATTSESDTQLTVYDDGNIVGSASNLNFDTNLSAKIPGVDTAYLSIDTKPVITAMEMGVMAFSNNSDDARLVADELISNQGYPGFKWDSAEDDFLLQGYSPNSSSYADPFYLNEEGISVGTDDNINGIDFVSSLDGIGTHKGTPFFAGVNGSNPGDLTSPIYQMGDRKAGFYVSSGDPHVVNSNGDTRTLFKNADVDYAPRSLWEGYISPDGMVIGNASNSEVGIDLEEGGAVYVDWVGSGDTSPAVVNVDSADTAFDITKTGCGGLINGSTRTANTWYQLGWAVDEDGNNPPCIVGWTHTSSTDSTPTTTTELPAGYELTRAMGTPGKYWWVKTDGSSNIYPFKHLPSGFIKWKPETMSDFSPVLSIASDDGDIRTINMSEQVPPVEQDVKITEVVIQDDGGAFIAVNFDSVSTGLTNDNVGEVVLDTDGSGGKQASQADFHGVKNQEIFMYVSRNAANAENIIVRRVGGFGKL